ncbi:hypothetical protein PAESOLCIP111_04272 [Paenibacillus solanacearum]|uniref:Alpha/beta hydrolase n=1 Tax=Paenibacillus solanacearum TaxID=2048548 RepID=A0A916K5L5_9BACL|nr:alpha/beta hydrolase-fold protein [Paenibacillus solanacearum]CAG7641818.1 hypothetical protein PAESOLCIP111_04272 [Paenibacillus solanacearum]
MRIIIIQDGGGVPEYIPALRDRPVPATGGRDAFFAFIEQELKPAIARLAPIDRQCQTLFGHSLGDLFALHIMYTDAEAFQTYVAADPSIWWNAGSILTEQARFIAARQDGRSSGSIDLLIETSGKKTVRQGLSESEAAQLARLRSGPTGEDVAAALTGLPGLCVAFRKHTSETHGSMVPYAVEDALSLSINPPAGERYCRDTSKARTVWQSGRSGFRSMTWY